MGILEYLYVYILIFSMLSIFRIAYSYFIDHKVLC